MEQSTKKLKKTPTHVIVSFVTQCPRTYLHPQKSAKYKLLKMKTLEEASFTRYQLTHKKEY